MAGGRPEPQPIPVLAHPQCLAEALLVLDVLCAQDSSFLYRSLSCLKGLQARLCGDPAWVRTLLPLAHFLLSHGEWRGGSAGSQSFTCALGPGLL